MRTFHNTVAAGLAAVALLTGRSAESAEIQLRRAGDVGQVTTELGEVIDLEIVIDPEGEEVTGYSFFVSFDSNVFRLVPKGPSLAGGGKQPLGTGDFLNGIVLLNDVQELGGEVILSYSEAASVQRSTATEIGVAARFCRGSSAPASRRSLAHHNRGARTRPAVTLCHS